MSAKQIIEAKRDGHELSPEQISSFLGAYLRKEIPDYQVSAWLMAVYLQGMTAAETRALTEALWKSGQTLPRSRRDDFWIDKHSTGGVGDKTSLILVPWVAACCERLFGKGRVKIPMVSGRGLGFSGGTLDKLESVRGVSVQVDVEPALRLLDSNGFFMLGQTDEVAPLDRLLYALRDVTGTVESIPLIVSSILSKKFAEHLDGIVFDVKVGSGAFMTTRERAETLAREMVTVSVQQGVHARALLTDMNEPLGRNVGNFLEIEECLDFVSGGPRERRLRRVTLELAAHMLSIASDGTLQVDAARAECEKELDRPDMLEKFWTMLEAQGGSRIVFSEQRTQWRSDYQHTEIISPAAGWVHQIAVRRIGELLVELGGGRRTKEDAIDPYVGFEFRKRIGDPVQAGECVGVVHHQGKLPGLGDLFGITAVEVVAGDPVLETLRA